MSPDAPPASFAFKTLWSGLRRSYRFIGSFRLLSLGVLAGSLAGLAAVGFFSACEFFRHILLVKLAGFELPLPGGERLFSGPPGAFRPWLTPIFLALVGLITGVLVKRFASESLRGGTDGTDAMIKAFHEQGGIIKPAAVLVRSVTAALTIAAGGSAGREGPISFLCGGLGSWLAVKLKLSAKERRILLLAGAAGGLGAIFRAPLGGAITAIEVIYTDDFEAEALAPAVASAVTAYLVFMLFFGAAPMFDIPRYVFNDARELPFYLLLALFCAASGRLYVTVFYYLKRNVFERLRTRLGVSGTMALAGLAMGALGAAFPPVLSDGYGWLEQAILGRLDIWLLVWVLLGKTLATCLTIGSGFSGGMFAPALFVGGMSGDLIGQLGARIAPQLVTQPGAYALVGMAAFFAGVAKAPIGPLLMVCELTQGYGLLAPLLLCSAVCVICNRRFALYENQRSDKFHSPAHTADATVNVLQNLLVRDYYRPGETTCLRADASFQEIRDKIAGSSDVAFCVLGEKDEYAGVITLQDARSALFSQQSSDLTARDITRAPAYVRPDYDLYAALMLCIRCDLPQVPVLDVDGEVIGTLYRADLLRAYAKAVESLGEA
jgi:CIC family chloride channel protein